MHTCIKAQILRNNCMLEVVSTYGYLNYHEVLQGIQQKFQTVAYPIKVQGHCFVW